MLLLKHVQNTTMLIRCKIIECNKSIKFKHNILTTIKGYNYSTKAIINTFRESRYSSTMVARTTSLIIANSEIKSHNYVSVKCGRIFCMVELPKHIY